MCLFNRPTYLQLIHTDRMWWSTNVANIFPHFTICRTQHTKLCCSTGRLHARMQQLAQRRWLESPLRTNAARVSGQVRFNIPVVTLQVNSETVLQAITCTGTDRKLTAKSIKLTQKKTQNTTIYYIHTHTQKCNIEDAHTHNLTIPVQN